MAKVGFWLQGSTGKLAGSALQKGVNGTVIRQIVKPKNPKTANQILQRVLMNTVSQGYSALQPIVCHAFQGKTEGAECQKTFMTENLNYFRQRAAGVSEDQLSSFVNFVPVGQKGIRPSAYIVSAGSLPRIPVSINQAFSAVMALSANTYQAVIDDYDLKRGDQLTFIVIEESTVTAGEYIAKWSRIILDPRNADGTEAPLSSAFIADNAINLPNSKNAGNFGGLSFAEGMVFNMKASAKVCAAGIIVSRLDGEEWKRSNCQLVVSEDAIGEYGISLSRAITISREKYSVYMSDANQYLDNAGVSGGQSTDSGEGSDPGEDTTPSVNDTVKINGVNQNVAGGSVTVTGPITSMEVTGQNLTADVIKVRMQGNVAGEWAISENGTKATWTAPEDFVYPKTASVYFNSSVNVWFTLNAGQQSGGGVEEG